MEQEVGRRRRWWRYLNEGGHAPGPLTQRRSVSTRARHVVRHDVITAPLGLGSGPAGRSTYIG